MQSNDSDPISLLLTPPLNETSEQAALRLAKEAEARRISDEIDRAIQQEREALKNQNVLKMLILGQSESGKSFGLYSRFTFIELHLSREIDDTKEYAHA